ncbi:MAG TPA: hypothetical protein VHL31_07240 [Geminicoccus sp.]|jgi:hypothetical protein|uniref:hypothetical protein n=1 Tax=Geminicoccus sp. TaxID=2024832 RepID=UPI002E363009|nr:hypothetical protein [Geminicoccus sp.]HEX2526080.1 hypothetical protein [Geminicoccus sp.]
MQVTALAPHEFEPFRNLTFPVMRRLLDPAEGGRIVCVGAWSDGQPAGLALGVMADDQLCELASFHVLPFFMTDSLTATLLDRWETEAAARGARHAIHFFTAKPGDDPTARFFLSRGWAKPTVRTMVCRATIEVAFATNWFVRARMPAGCHAVPWVGLTDEQRATLVPAGTTPWYPPALDPFHHERGCDAATSVGLLETHDGRERLVGWVITHKLDEVALRWTSSFVRQDLQRTGHVVPLWLEVAKRQRDATTLTDFIFTVPVEQPRMMRFTARRMGRDLSECSFGCFTTKKLEPSG